MEKALRQFDTDELAVVASSTEEWGDRNERELRRLEDRKRDCPMSLEQRRFWYGTTHDERIADQRRVVEGARELAAAARAAAAL